MVLIKKYYPFLLFISIYLIYCALTFTHFGITWDEQAVYTRGSQLFQYFFNHSGGGYQHLLIKNSSSDAWPAYNNWYSMVLYIFNQEMSYEIYHLENLLFASILFISSYFVLVKKYPYAWLCLLGPLFIVLNPRLFGNVPGNPKDVPFAVMYFLSIAAIYLLPLNKRLERIILLGVLFGLTHGLRIIGFGLYFVLLAYDIYQYYFNKTIRTKYKNIQMFLLSELGVIGLIFILANCLMVFTWPYLISSYPNHFFEVVNIAKQFPWKGSVLFMGKMFLAKNLPLYYLPVWLSIGMPLFIILSFLGSLYFIWKKKLKNDLLFLLLFAIAFNLILYFVLRPVIYNGLRHFLFLLPLFSVVSALVFIEIIRSKQKLLKQLCLLFLVLNSIMIVYTQIDIFPYQYLYFNETVGGLHGASANFETDYWAASTLSALDWLKKDTANQKTININTCGLPLVYLYYFSRNMNWVSSPSKANYVICNTRQPQYTKIKGKIIYSVMRDGVPLSDVFQITK